MLEEWKDIKGWEGLYQVSNTGLVKNIVTGYLKKQDKSHRKYYFVSLWNKGKSKRYSVHRLVAEHFIPNPLNKPFVNHKDGNKLNNNVTNLEWVTPSENAQHAHDTGLAFVENKDNILVYNWKTNQYIDTFRTEEDAASSLNIKSRRNINSCLIGNRDFELDYIFLYEKEFSDSLLNSRVASARCNNQANCDRKVLVYSIDNTLYNIYNSLTECVIALNLNIGNTSECLNGKRKSHKGFTFKWEPRSY